MNITEIRIRLPQGAGRRKAYASVTFDNVFAVREIMVVDTTKGLLVVMPHRPYTDYCPGCGGITPVTHRFCGHCGKELGKARAPLDDRGKPRISTDVAHPITREFRGVVEQAVLAAFAQEVARTERNAE